MTRQIALHVSWLVLALGCSSQALREPGDSAPDDTPGSAGGSPGGPAPSGNDALPPLEHADYPAGPYGHGEGATIANLSFLGWRAPAEANYDLAQLEQLSLADFYNPTGAADRPLLLLLNASAVWCSVCRAEYQHMSLEDVYDSVRPKGVEILGSLFQDNDSNPAKPSDLVNWAGNKGFKVHFPFVLDPGFKLGPFFTSDATPMNLLIDTRNMHILNITMGYDTQNPDRYWNAIVGLLK